jgi:hypothetical protein
MATKAFKLVNDDGEEYEVQLPVRKEVCSRCEGEGTHLHSDIGAHAYTSEEFAQEYDDEEAAEYFKRGGRYDVTCEVCGGLRVVDVIDEEACKTVQQKADLAAVRAAEDEEYHYQAMCRAEQMMGA